MCLEKLQYFATAVASPSFKAQWLKWWNSSIHTREALHFLPKGFTNKDLEPWLNKASFWARVIIVTFLFRLELLILLEMLPSLYILSLFIINYVFHYCS
jgi:hypothetical protein